MAKQKGTDLDDVPTNGGDKPRIEDKVALFKFPKKKWVTVRLFGPIFSYGNYWVETKKKDGSKSRFPAPCPSFDPATGQRDPAIYDPWRDLLATYEDKKDSPIQYSTVGFINGIVRAAQRGAPKKLPKPTAGERKTGFKEMDSDSFTPCSPIRLTFGGLRKVKELSGLNVRSIKGQSKAFSVTHEKYGCDIRVYYDPDKAAADQYQFQIGDKSPMTEEELALLTWDLSDLVEIPAEAEIKRDFESWATRNGVKLKGKKKPAAEDDDDDIPEDDGEDDDDEPKRKPKAKAKAPVKGKAKIVDDDDDDDFDDDSDEDDEDEPVAKKKKPAAKPAAKGKKKPADDEDDEDDSDEDDDDSDDDDFEDDDSDDDEDDSDEDDDDDDSDDDEDDEPPARKKKPVAKAKAPVKGKKKPADDEDDDFEEDDSDDEDEDDEPPAKKKKPAAKARPKSKRPADDEDDDEDEDSDEDDDLDDDDEDEDDEPVAKKKKPAAKAKPVAKPKRR